MRKIVLSLVALGPLAIVAGLTLPVAAESAGGPTPDQAANEALNLDAIPVQPVTGPLAIKGVAGDEEDDGMPGVREAGGDDGRWHEQENDD
jgi:hypothetical protein